MVSCHPDGPFHVCIRRRRGISRGFAHSVQVSRPFIFRSHTWDFIRIDKVVWSVLPSQALTLLAMISVVALSSSLDIAAIEIELKRPLDYNHELRTVGWSNVISGLLGGYTGSYSEFLRRVRSLHGLTELFAAYSILADDLLVSALAWLVDFPCPGKAASSSTPLATNLVS